MKRLYPPLLVCRLLGSVLPVTYQDSMLGDLIEEYAIRSDTTSPWAASIWFLSQACRSVPFMVWSLLRKDLLIRITAAVGVFLAMTLLKLSTGLMISKIFVTGQTIHVVLAPILFLIKTAIGGCAAARIRQGSTIFLALFVMISVAVMIALNVCPIPVPWWYQFGFLALGPLSVLIVPSMVWSLKPINRRTAI